VKRLIYIEKARAVYEKMLDVLYRKTHDYNKSWDYLVDFIAVDHCPPLLREMEHKFEWFFGDEKFANELIKVYDLDALKSDKRDHLGDLYVEKQGKLNQSYKGQFLTPENVVEAMVEMTVGKTDEELNILDPCVGTGRFLLKAHENAPNARLFGVDTDLRVLRVAFANCAIRKVPAYLLHADSLMHDTSLATEEGRYNWSHANRWHSCMDKLKSFAPRKFEPVETEALTIYDGQKQSKLEMYEVNLS
jgi:hypothetical protein